MFANLRDADFINLDDQPYVTENPMVLSGLTPGGVAWAFTGFAASYWHPLTWLSLEMDVSLFGPGPAGFHTTNVVLHAANAALVYLVLRRLTGNRWPSAAAAGLFALHPLHVESVAWVTERKDLLSTFFGLLALLAYAGYVARPGAWRYAAVAAAFTLSLLAKPMLVTLPCVLLLVDYWPLARWPGQPRALPARRLLLEKVPLLALAAAASAVTVAAQHTGGATQSLQKIPLPSRLANAILSYRDYLRQTVLPIDLAAFYEHQKPGLLQPGVLVTAAVLLAVTAAVLRRRREAPYLMVGWLWYLGTLVPVIGIVQVGLQARADRFTYVPLLGVFVALAWAGAALVRCRRLPAVVAASLAVAALLGCGILSWVQAGYWHGSETLWRHALRVAPPNRTVVLQLSNALVREGRLEEALHCYNQGLGVNPQDAVILWNRAAVLMRLGLLDLAGHDLRAAVAADPADAQARTNLAILCARQGWRAEAIDHYEEAVRLDADLLSARANLGMELFADGQPEAACRQLAEAVRRHPQAAQARKGLGIVQTWLGRDAEAVASLEEAARRGPPDPMLWHHLALAWGLQERWHEAADCGRKAVVAAPQSGELRGHLAFCLRQLGDGTARAERDRSLRDEPDWPRRLGRTAWRWATDPAPGRRNGRQALYLARVCCNAVEGRDPELLDVLAAAHAELGQFGHAADAARSALERTGGNAALADGIRGRLRLYEMSRPFREPLSVNASFAPPAGPRFPPAGRAPGARRGRA